jgi:DNA-binding NtrC family response regulator
VTRKAKNDQSYRVLIVDDHASARESVADVLRHAGYDVATCASAIEALGKLAQRPVDVVVTDLQMPGMDGLEFIREMERRQLAVQILMITAHASVASAVEAMRHGAFDYLEKPFDALKLEQSVSRACDRRRLMQAAPAADTPSGLPAGAVASAACGLAGPIMIGNSHVMRDLRSRIAQVAVTDETVLICGESGTGKELVAQSVHAQSRRIAGPLVSLNCPVLAAQLTESELFGHKRGAFTGADADRTGRFELAKGGSILLDEVTEIDLSLQAKLLRVLQERTFERVGSSETVSVDVRILATTNRDLRAEVAAGRFREDLYFRLAVVPLVIPPLRERGDDVLALVDYFLDQAYRRLERGPFELEPTARKLLVGYEWPGNVRELQNIVTRACVLNSGEPIRADELRPWLREGRKEQIDPAEDVAEPQDLLVGMKLDDVERRLIETTLARYEGHRAKTAAALGIGIRTLSGKLRAYGYAPREKDFAKAG